MLCSILKSLLMRHLIWKGAFFGPCLERVLCPLEFEIQITIWTLRLGGASPTSVSVLSTATWECILEKRKHPNFKECITWTAFTSVTKGNVHKRALKGELHCPFSHPYTLLFSLQTFPLVWLSCMPLQHKVKCTGYSFSSRAFDISSSPEWQYILL